MRALHVVLAFVLLLATVLASCTPGPTQLVVVVDTDLAIPSALDDVEIRVSSDTGVMEEQHQPLSSRLLLPLTLGVVTDGEFLGPILVVARGTLDGALVVERSARVTLVRGETRMLRLHLVASCVGVACARGESCGENGCEDIDIAELPPWPGMPPTLPRDAGMDARAVPDAPLPDAPGLDVGPIDARMPSDAPDPPDAFRACTADIDCDDGVACTMDSCDGSRCVYVASDTACGDGESCTDDRCVPGVGCSHTPNSATCTDGVFCNGFDMCSGGTCSIHTGASCAPPTVCDEAAALCRGCVTDGDCSGETLGPWGGCTFADSCVESGMRSRARRTEVCTDNVCVPTDTTVTESCPRETDGNSCGMGSCGGWGACSFGDECGETGTQSRTCADLACGDGVCRTSMRVETTSCPRETDGNPCSGGSTCDPYGACDYTDACDESATQYRTCYDRRCVSGSCGSTPRTEPLGCSRGTNGVSCGAGLVCSGGSCVSCAPTLSGSFGSGGAFTSATGSGSTLTFQSNTPASGNVSVPGVSMSGTASSGICLWGAVGMGDRIRFYDWDATTSWDVVVSGASVSGSSTPPCNDFPPYGCFYPCMTAVHSSGSSLQFEYSGVIEGSITFACP